MESQRNSGQAIRYNIISTIVYIIGIVLIVRLFNLQIVNGKEYRQQSNTKLTRESTVEAARGSILDRIGNKIATITETYNLELYKSKIETEVLNKTLLKVINILEQNGDTYNDSLPIKANVVEFSVSEEEQIKWKQSNKIKGETAQEVFEYLKQRYKIQNEDIIETRKIMGLRYEIEKNGYSLTKAVRIAKNISRTSALQFNEQNIDFPGITVVVSPVRKYTQNNFASHILGYVGQISSSELEGKEEVYDRNDTIGKGGIEYVFEEYLKGKNGIKHIDMSVDGTVSNESIINQADEGSDVILTIDANLQKVAEDALENNIKKIASGAFGERSDTNSGAVVAMNVNTGEILAMASFPNYNPNDFINGISSQKWNEYNENSARPLYNRAIQGEYAPGSTFKMATAIAALESGNVRINEKVNDKGVYPHSYNPVCWLWTSKHKGHGYLDISNAIKHSCNYFFYEMGYRMGIDVLEKYATYLGLGNKTGVELVGEANGTLAKRSIVESKGGKWYVADTLSASIGQSYNNFTPIQMAKYTSMIANGGKKIDVTIVKSIINSDGTEVNRQEVNEYIKEKLGVQDDTGEEIKFKDENIKAVLEGMRSVTTESGGTAYSIFKNFNIEVGGKTGSAEAKNKTNGWFVGFAPYDKPEIAVVVMVENAGHGSYTAEVARDIIAQYFGMNANKITENLEGIPEIEMQR
ncbi:MAG: penicillin-binding protein 2 [Clostridia bacterium]|nr:penicillin-binding protein 2 [Clostridia bacterium]